MSYTQEANESCIFLYTVMANALADFWRIQPKSSIEPEKLFYQDGIVTPKAADTSLCAASF